MPEMSDSLSEIHVASISEWLLLDFEYSLASYMYNLLPIQHTTKIAIKLHVHHWSSHATLVKEIECINTVLGKCELTLNTRFS